MKIENTLDASAASIKIVVAAEAGNGKTTLAKTIKDTLNENVLVISAEAGLLSLRGSSVDYVELQRKWDDEKKTYIEVPEVARVNHLVEIFQYVSKPETQAKYKWLFIDSLTEVNQNILKHLDSLEEFQGPKNTIKKFGELSTRMRALCKAFRDLPHYDIVFSALVKTDTNQDNQQTMKIDMTGKFSSVLPSLFDEILYLGVTSEVDERTGKNVRKLLTQKTDKIEFPKDRSGTLDRLEPADLGVIARKIRAGLKPALIPDVSGQAKAAHAAVVEAKAATAEPVATVQ